MYSPYVERRYHNFFQFQVITIWTERNTLRSAVHVSQLSSSMRSTRVSSRGIVQPTVLKDAVCIGKTKGSKKVSDVAIVEESDDLELQRGMKEEISPSTLSPPNSAVIKKLPSVVTPGDDKMKSVSKTSKPITKKNGKGVFGRLDLIKDFGDDAIAARKAPLEVSPLVDIVYR